MATKPKETASASETPTLHTVAPLWVEASDRLQELCLREREIGAELGLLKPQLDRQNLALWREQNLRHEKSDPAKPPKLIEASPRAASLLGKFAPAPREAEPSEAVSILEPKLVKRTRELSEELAAISEAKALLAPQLERAHREGSKRLCELLMPEYKSIANRICAALVELGSANDAHRAFMERHRNASRMHWGLVHDSIGGDAREPHSELRRALAWAAEVGHFDLADLPAEWSKTSANAREWPGADAPRGAGALPSTRTARPGL